MLIGCGNGHQKSHYKPFCYSEDAFLNRLFIVLILDQLKQSKVWARCAFIQPVKANQAVNQANLELGLTEGNRYGSSEPQGTRYGYSEPQSNRDRKPTFRFYRSSMNLNWKGSRQRSAPAVSDQVIDLWSELRAELRAVLRALPKKQ